MTKNPAAFCAVVLLLAACGQTDKVATDADASIDRSTPQATTHVIHPSPDVSDAQWWATKERDGLVFGNALSAPMLSLVCNASTQELDFFRHVEAPEGGKAMAAFDGKGPIARWHADAVPLGNGSVWKGAVDLDDERLVVLEEPRRVELTIPGAGTLRLAESDEPAQLIQTCREDAGKLASGLPLGDPNAPAPPAPPASPE